MFVVHVMFARDNEGHGSHISPTIGGSFVPGANVFGIENGTTSYGSPKARVATCKVCWPSLTSVGGGCFDVNIMTAFE
ncbi:Peptidase S8 [Vigna unguiculata]|uniref:Peptidase S8 n=1 Tax=Vigna unguiculata TaxID=3917 RepID=A0A4D6NM31_VIGUN|nr:Peptidase S8 [Vigna unguiculata]